VLVVRSTKVTREIMDGTELAVVIRAGAGVNTIDLEAANEFGIRVTNCPGKNAQAVAELAFGLILAADRSIPDNVADLRGGVWNKKKYSQSRGLHGRTLGLVGMGKISQEMIPRAQAFGMTVVALSRWMTPDVAATIQIKPASGVEELAALSDIVSVHVALTPETNRLCNASFFDHLRPGSIFINTSRAEIVDQEALLHAVNTKGIKAGLDVFEGEPDTAEGSYHGVMQQQAGVYCTHHIGASTEQAQESVAMEVVQIVREYKQSGTVRNMINVRQKAVATHVLVVRHHDRVGVLAHILGVLKDESVNVQEMENIVLGGAKTAIAQISIDKEIGVQAQMAIKMNANVLDVNLFALGQ
jgi:D-3-phosphoglycerate dehydrogenase / 2-oxoglutarate reductase